MSGGGESEGYSPYAGGAALRPVVWFGTKSTQAGRQTGYYIHRSKGKKDIRYRTRLSEKKKSRKKDKLEGREEIISIKDDEPEGDWPDKKREVERLNMIFSLRGKSSDRAVCAFQFRGSARKIHTSAEWKKNSGGGE